MRAARSIVTIGRSEGRTPRPPFALRWRLRRRIGIAGAHAATHIDVHHHWTQHHWTAAFRLEWLSLTRGLASMPSTATERIRTERLPAPVLRMPPRIYRDRAGERTSPDPTGPVAQTMTHSIRRDLLRHLLQTDGREHRTSSRIERTSLRRLHDTVITDRVRTRIDHISLFTASRSALQSAGPGAEPAMRRPARPPLAFRAAPAKRPAATPRPPAPTIWRATPPDADGGAERHAAGAPHHGMTAHQALAVASAAAMPAPAPQSAPNLAPIVDEVLRRIERQGRSERLRRGI